MTKEPTPLFLATVLVIFVFVGTAIKGVEPIVTMLLLLILVGLVLMGYGNIHQVFVQLGIATNTATQGVGALANDFTEVPFSPFSTSSNVQATGTLR